MGTHRTICPRKYACFAQEPEILADEREALQRSLASMAVSQHGAFITAADCLGTIAEELQAVHTHLEHLLQVVRLGMPRNLVGMPIKTGVSS
jgi:hypothetical protein